MSAARPIATTRSATGMPTGKLAVWWVVASEIVTTSISSGGDGSEVASPLLALNPHVRYFADRRGHVRARFTPTEVRVEFRTLPYVSRPGAPVATAAASHAAARRRSDPNFRSVLQARHGTGVRPSRYASAKGPMTLRSNSSAMFRT